MAVDNFNLHCALVCPDEAYAPLVIDAYIVLPDHLAEIQDGGRAGYEGRSIHLPRQHAVILFLPYAEFPVAGCEPTGH